MTATQHIEIVKDGNGTIITGGWADVVESVSGAKASATYLKNADESLVAAPMQMTGGSVQANAGTNLNTSALALETGGNLATLVTEAGSLTETAPVSDTASSGLNGRLQRIAQRLSTLITALGSPLQAGGTVILGAGSAIAAKFSIDQTTPGTTNGVQVIATNSGTTSPSAAPTVTAASAYAIGNEVGGLLTFTNVVNAGPLSGVLQSIEVMAKSVQTTGLKLYLFSTNPTNSTWTDKSAPAINAADIPFLMGEYSLVTPDSGLGTHTVWNLDGIGKAFVAAAMTIYGVLVCTGTPTWGSTSDVTVKLGVLKD